METSVRMALSGKQVRQLRSLANNLKTTIQVGKEGVTDNIVKQVESNLEAHELVKVGMLCDSGEEAAELGREIAERTGADMVQVIGKRVVLYRETSRDDVKKIELA